MKKIVIIPGDFYPWHGGHTALYLGAKSAFPSADVFVAASNKDSSKFPFKIKKMLAQAAGVPGNRFIQVENPFVAKEITQLYDPDNTQLIFVQGDKDQSSTPVVNDSENNYLLPYKRQGLQPMKSHAYLHYLPTAQFGPGMTSATEIRSKWDKLNNEQKSNLIKTMYPAMENNVQALTKLMEIFNSVMSLSSVEETIEVIDADDQVSTSEVEEPTSLKDLTAYLMQVVKLIQQKDSDAVKSLLSSEQFQHLIRNLEHSASTDIEDRTSADYAEEK